MLGHSDWSHRGDYIVAKHGVTPEEADEALADPERIVIDPDYNSASGRSVRIIGFSQAARDLLTVIVLTAEERRGVRRERVAVKRAGQTHLRGRGTAMSQLKDLLDAEGAATEAAEADQKTPARTDKVTRGHDRVRTLQIRLNEDELGELSVLARDRSLPVSTVARQLLLQSLAPADDLKSVLDRLERDISAVRRKALSV